MIIETMISGNDAANFILGDQMLVGNTRLKVQGGNGVVRFLAFKREITAHDLKRNVGAGIG